VRLGRIVQKPVPVVEPHARVHEALLRAEEAGSTALVVTVRGRPVGILEAAESTSPGEDQTVSSRMDPNFPWLYEDAGADDAAKKMADSGRDFVVVRDRQGLLLGIVTLHQISRLAEVGGWQPERPSGDPPSYLSCIGIV
jgi:CBS domain-containing protein